MAEEIWGFDEPTVRRLLNTVRTMERRIVTLENKLANISVRRHEAGGQTGDGYAAKTDPVVVSPPSDGGVPAATEVDGVRTAGEAQVTLYKFLDGVLTETPYRETVYNMAMEAVAADVYIQLKRDAISKKLLVDWEECA